MKRELSDEEREVLDRDLRQFYKTAILILLVALLALELLWLFH